MTNEASVTQSKDTKTDIDLNILSGGSVAVMGALNVPAEQLLSRNDRVSRACGYEPTVTRFNVNISELEIDGVTKRFDNSVARLVGVLLLREPGLHNRTELAAEIEDLFQVTPAFSKAILSTAATALKYGRIGAAGPLLVAEGRQVGLREDLVFLPFATRAMYLAVDNTRARQVGASKSEKLKKPKLKYHSRAGQYYVQWWDDYVPTKSEVVIEQSAPPRKVKNQLKLIFPKFKKEKPIPIAEMRNGQFHARWWPRYVPGKKVVLANENTESVSIAGQMPFVWPKLYDEDVSGQGCFYFDDRRTDTSYSELHEVGTLVLNPHQLKLKFRSEKVNPVVPKNPDKVTVFSDTAKVAAYDFIFCGGDMPVATDIATYNALQGAIKEIGGYGFSVSESNVVKQYQNGNANLSQEVRLRIQQLGETIHGYRGRGVTPSNPSLGKSLTLAGSLEWIGDAACRDTDPNLFFPVGTTGPAIEQIENAKAVCRSCDAQADCLEYAILARVDDGIWGGASEDERRAIRRRRNAT